MEGPDWRPRRREIERAPIFRPVCPPDGSGTGRKPRPRTCCRRRLADGIMRDMESAHERLLDITEECPVRSSNACRIRTLTNDARAISRRSSIRETRQPDLRGWRTHGLSMARQMLGQPPTRPAAGSRFISQRWATTGSDVKKLIEQGADVNATDRYGHTPLFFARERLCCRDADRQLAPMSRPYREDGAEPRSAGRCARTTRRVVSLLVSSGADVNARTQRPALTAAFHCPARRSGLHSASTGSAWG